MCVCVCVRACMCVVVRLIVCQCMRERKVIVEYWPLNFMIIL